MGCLQGKVALVFGAGSSGPGWGNGKAAEVAYAREGARVVAIDKEEDAVRETAEIIRGEGFEGLGLCADVTDSPSVQAAVAQAIERFGQIDILHNNVGITVMGG